MLGRNATGEVHLQYEISLVYKYLIKIYPLFTLYNATNPLIKPSAVEVTTWVLGKQWKKKPERVQLYRVIHKSLRDFRTRLRNNQDRHGRKEHINR